jgi:D-alanyl-D-alanine carboxypeptidase
MKKTLRILTFAMSAFLTLTPISCAFCAEIGPETSCESHVLIDSASGNVLCEKRADERMFPASTTKIMTAVLAIENRGLGEKIMVRQKTLDSFAKDPEISNMALKAGEEFTLRELLDGMMVTSANDAANVIAEHIGGNIPNFVAMMNSRARELDAASTNFINPDGYPHDDHYTTARDLATITRHAMTIPCFREIVAQSFVRIAATAKSDERYYINSNNLMSPLRFSEYYYKRAIGVKTGASSFAGFCLVSAARDGETELISVVMKAKNMHDSHTDSKNLLEYGFNNFRRRAACEKGARAIDIKIKHGKGKKTLALVCENNLTALLPKNFDRRLLSEKIDAPQSINAPIQRGQILGRKTFFYAGQPVGAINLMASESVKRTLWGKLTLWLGRVA